MIQAMEELGTAHRERETVLTIGVFDGVHRGHQMLIGRVVERARATGREAGVLTFRQHPRGVLHPERRPQMLMTVEDRVHLVRELGVDFVVVLTFSLALSKLTAEEFMGLVRRQLKLRELIVGASFALGRGREGTVPRLREIGRQLDYAVEAVAPLEIDGQRVSSTLIRDALTAGETRRATHLLGRQPFLRGRVVRGDERGRLLGFPTANLEIEPDILNPADGVYAGWAEVDGRRRPAAVNVGVRPTFDGGRRLIEVHLLDFDGDLYGRDLVLHLVDRLRPERRFGSLDELIAQIRQDIARTRELLGVTG